MADNVYVVQDDEGTIWGPLFLSDAQKYQELLMKDHDADRDDIRITPLSSPEWG